MLSRHRLITSLIALTSAMCAATKINAEDAPQPILLFDSGREGYPRYRIPALIVTPTGNVLAFCEGRKDGGGLTGNIDIVVKRSRDNGKTWQPLATIIDDADNTLGNPCPLIDRDTGTIWLPITRSFGQDTERQIVDGTSRQRTRVLITHSSDDGRTWAKPRDITKSVKRPEWTWHGTGPGTGIQLRGKLEKTHKRGRLLIPCYHVDEQDKIYRSHAIYSDDHGKTWQLGETVGDNTSECHVVERTDGDLYLDARTVVGTELRTISLSHDRGHSWEKPTFHKGLYDSHCQGCMYQLTGAGPNEKSRWLFSNPAGPGRHHLTVRLSYDEGTTWPIAKRLQAGDSQYSSLALLSDRSIGCLYERWVDGNYRIYFVRFTLAWLTDGKDRLKR